MRALRRPIRALRHERGAVSIEYIALIAVVVAVLGVVVASSPAIGEAISGRIVALIQGIGEGSEGGGAPDGQEGGGRGPPGQGAEPAGEDAPAPPEEEDDDDGFLGGVADFAQGAASGIGDFASGAGDIIVGGAQGTGAFLDGLVLGDIHGSGYDSPGLETARALGHGLSGIVAVGDVRDSLFNLGRVAVSGGEGGKGDLALSLFGIIPYAGDAAKIGKLADGVRDTFRAADRAGDARRAPDAPPPRRSRGAACPSNSFTQRTPVLMADGRSQAIADVEVGDRVLATDPRTGETGPRPVEQVIVGEGQKTLVRIRVGAETLAATDRHPFWVASRRAWTDAEDLRPGDVLREPDGSTAAVESVGVLAPEPERVYNLTVSGLHTYYAGEAPVLVHNQNCASPERTNHILYGDKTGSGGGHLWPGRPGKTPFPQSWDADRVMREISDVATDPASVSRPGQGGRTIVSGTRDGVEIEVLLERPNKGGGIVTGYPTNLPRNPP